jgi:hypothetical protein
MDHTVYSHKFIFISIYVKYTNKYYILFKLSSHTEVYTVVKINELCNLDYTVPTSNLQDVQLFRKYNSFPFSCKVWAELKR